MKKTILWAGILAACLVSASAWAAPYETLATHAFMIDVNTGSVLLDKASDEKMPTSSMSKTMTLYMVFDALKKGQIKLTDELPVSEKAWREGGAASGGSCMFLHVGSTVKVEDLIRGVAIQSGNDAAIVLAEGLAGAESTFAERMNKAAEELGMTNSHFMNASGLPVEGHYSTARDLALLAQHLVTDFPEYYHYFGEKEFTYNKIRQQNRDPLLGKVQGSDGIKTGHTEVAGYGLMGSAKRGDRRLILVVNGLKSEKERAEEGAKLMEWGFRNFENKKIVAKDAVIEQAKVWLGTEETVPMVAAQDVVISVPVGHGAGFTATAKYEGPIEAPIAAGAPVGKLHIMVEDLPPIDIGLVAGKDVARAGLFGRAMARFNHFIHKD